MSRSPSVFEDWVHTEVCFGCSSSHATSSALCLSHALCHSPLCLHDSCKKRCTVQSMRSGHSDPKPCAPQWSASQLAQGAIDRHHHLGSRRRCTHRCAQPQAGGSTAAAPGLKRLMSSHATSVQRDAALLPRRPLEPDQGAQLLLTNHCAGQYARTRPFPPPLGWQPMLGTCRQALPLASCMQSAADRGQADCMSGLHSALADHKPAENAQL